MMCNRPLGFYIYKDTGKLCHFYGENLKLPLKKRKKKELLMGESSFFLNKRGVYEKVMCNRPCGFYKYKNSGKVCFFYGGSLNVV